MTTENKNDLPIEARNQDEEQGKGKGKDKLKDKLKVKFSSLFPSLLLVFQLLLLLLGVFKIEHELIAAINSFLKTSSIFLNILMGIFIIWYWTKKPVFKQDDFNKKDKAKYTIICIANGILLNKLYDNSNLNVLFEAGNLIYVFLIIVPIVAFFIARYMSKETDNEQKEKRNLPLPLPKPRKVRVAKQKLTPVKRRAIHDQEVVPKAMPNNESKIFAIVFSVISLLIAFFGYLVISKLNFPSGLLNGKISQKEVAILIAVIILLFFIVPAVIFFLIWMARLIARFIKRMPNYFEETEKAKLDKQIIESIVGSVLFLILVFAGKLLGLNGNWLKDRLDVPDFLTVPFGLIFTIAFSMIFTKMIYAFFWGVKSASARLRIETIASDTLNRIILICEGTIKSFFRLIYVFPDFTDSIETVLFGEEEDNEPNNTNPPNNSNTNNPGASNPCTNLGGGSNSGTNKAGASNTGTNNPSSGNNQNNQL